MKKKFKCRQYCLSAKDLRQRYDEDIEEAMEDGFQGPVAKALHAFEYLQALVIVVLMMATLTLLLVNWIFIESIQFVDSSLLEIPSAGECKFSTTSSELYYFGGQNIPCNMLQYDENGTKLENPKFYKSKISENIYPLPPTNVREFPYAKCTFVFTMNETEYTYVIKRFKSSEETGQRRLLYMKPLDEWKFKMPTTDSNETLACFNYREPDWYEEKLLMNYGIILLLVSIGSMVILIELANSFAPHGHPLQSLARSLNKFFLSIPHRCQKECCQPELMNRATHIIRNRKHTEIKHGKDEYYDNENKHIVYESPKLIDEYDKLPGEANMNIQKNSDPFTNYTNGVYDNFACKFCTNNNIFISPTQKAERYNLEIPLPEEDGRGMKFQLQFVNGPRTTHLFTEEGDPSSPLDFELYFIVEKLEPKENTSLKERMEAKINDFYTSFVQTVFTTTVYNLLISITTTTNINIIGNNDEMYDNEQIYIGPGLWAPSVPDIVLVLLRIVLWAFIWIPPFYGPAYFYFYRDVKKAGEEVVSFIFLIYGIMGLGIAISSAVDILLNASTNMTFGDFAFGVSLDWATLSFKVPPISVPIAAFTFTCGFLRISMYLSKIFRHICKRRKLGIGTLLNKKIPRVVPDIVEEEEDEGEEESIIDAMKAAALDAAISTAEEKIQEKAILKIDERFKEDEEKDDVETKPDMDNKKLIKIPTAVQYCTGMYDGMTFSKNPNQPAFCTGTYNEVSCASWSLMLLKGSGWTITGMQMKYRYCASREYVTHFKSSTAFADNNGKMVRESPWGKDTFFRILGIVDKLDDKLAHVQTVVDMNDSSDSIKKRMEEHRRCISMYKKQEEQQRQASQQAMQQQQQQGGSVMAVQVPDGIGPGQMVQIQTPKGIMQVKIPQGVGPGMTFHIRV
jgi:hypothetical protein